MKYNYNMNSGDVKIKSQYQTMKPAGRFDQSAEVAKAVIWLCSDAASLLMDMLE
jgi:NAD(P)-dependent dehydrogenase (short-subunit alcohol dehydrogenase family)